MRDPYTVLGVPRDAAKDQIKQAYRKLARTLHPDRDPGNAAALDRFKEVTVAYDILSDAKKRVRYDRGEIDAGGNEIRRTAARRRSRRPGHPRAQPTQPPPLRAVLPPARRRTEGRRCHL